MSGAQSALFNFEMSDLMLRSDFGSALRSGAQKSGALELVAYRALEDLEDVGIQA